MDPIERARPATIGVALTVALVTGIALGFGTQILQGSLSGSWSVLANSGVMWILVAFGLGMIMPSTGVAALGGAIALVTASVSYYLAVDLFEGISSTPRGAVVWSIAGIMAGPSFCVAGFLARHNQRHRPSAWALLAGVFTGEGVHLTWYVGNNALRPAGIVELVLAAVIAIVLLRRTRTWLVAGIAAATALATLLAGHLIDGVFATW